MSSEISIIPPDRNDPYEDNCAPLFENSRAIALLKINGITIPLSMERVKDLTEQLNSFNRTVFCYKCEHFIMSKSGWNYGGSCKLKALKDNYVLTENDAGYRYGTDCMDTCKECSLKKSEDITVIHKKI